MTMQRRHYELIASVLKGTRPGFGFAHEAQSDRYLQWEKDVFAFNKHLRTTNPNFNPSRFLKACGVEDGQ